MSYYMYYGSTTTNTEQDWVIGMQIVRLAGKEQAIMHKVAIQQANQGRVLKVAKGWVLCNNEQD